MLWRVDLSSSTPLFEQVASSVRRAIADGVVVPGDRLPAAKEVADSLDINMHTVLRSYQELRDEGLIELRKGRGAVVLACDPGVARLRSLLDHIVAEAAKLGFTSDDLVGILKGKHDYRRDFYLHQSTAQAQPSTGKS